MSFLAFCCCCCPEVYIAIGQFFRAQFTKTQVYDILSDGDYHLTSDISIRAVDHYRQAIRLNTIKEVAPGVLGGVATEAVDTRIADNLEAGTAIVRELDRWERATAKNSTTNLVSIISSINK
ncbi:ORF38 [black bullhead herpesvirus]|uniref:ORF38 n=1 Tax=black bullhead herpesvirus TaxID=508441 RepID=A0A2H5AJG5_9VIRU|nr:ORF38 [black bullhead herpesvirus]AUG72291.1 ORF38 [black bullhead herpesvirus]